ncbi:hypothetical protein F5B20DRAFT_543765 [Whalleya microplaca]|nr:hypothetical protein F5B20DRAFT_543765 [Whalleya microplaca]
MQYLKLCALVLQLSAIAVAAPATSKCQSPMLYANACAEYLGMDGVSILQRGEADIDVSEAFKREEPSVDVGDGFKREEPSVDVGDGFKKRADNSE